MSEADAGSIERGDPKGGAPQGASRTAMRDAVYETEPHGSDVDTEAVEDVVAEADSADTICAAEEASASSCIFQSR